MNDVYTSSFWENHWQPHIQSGDVLPKCLFLLKYLFINYSHWIGLKITYLPSDLRLGNISGRFHEFVMIS